MSEKDVDVPVPSLTRKCEIQRTNINFTPVQLTDKSSRMTTRHYSDEDKLCWTAHIGGDQFACKHRLQYTYYFTYKQEQLKWTFKNWQFSICHANTGRYLHTFDHKEIWQLVDGQIVVVRYDNDGEYCWKGKKLKKWKETINLTVDWVHHNFYNIFTKRWKVSPGRWHKIMPGSQE